MQQIPAIDLSAARIGGLASRQAVAREIDEVLFSVSGLG
jgi:hypothetical protein